MTDLDWAMAGALYLLWSFGVFVLSLRWWLDSDDNVGFDFFMVTVFSLVFGFMWPLVGLAWITHALVKGKGP